MIWTILGFGALGGVIACQLQHAGQHVRVILPRKFQSQATSIVNFHGYQSENPLRLAIEFHSPAQPIQEGALIVATKGYDVIPALETWKPYIAPHLPIFLLNNGMGVDEHVRILLPNNHIITGVTELGAMHREHCSYRITGQGATWLGTTHNTETEYATQAIHQFKSAIPQSHWTHFIQSRQWQKLTLNSVINPLTSKYNVKNGALLDPKFIPTIQDLCDELTVLSTHLQLKERKVPIINAVLSLAEKTRENSSSMRQDILNQRKTEIDLITGYILQQAEKFNVDMPTHTTLYQEIKQLENTYGT